VEWNTVAGATSYNIYMGTSPGAETLFVANLTGVYRGFAGVNGTTYYLTVAGVNAGGIGPQSSEVSAKPAVVTGGPPTDGGIAVRRN
jgi:hypothetical protein